MCFSVVPNKVLNNRFHSALPKKFDSDLDEFFLCVAVTVSNLYGEPNHMCQFYFYFLCMHYICAAENVNSTPSVYQPQAS